MVNIEKKVSEVLNKSLKNYPGTSDLFWDMGTIHSESIVLINTLLDDLMELIKKDYNVEFNNKEFKEKYYE